MDKIYNITIENMQDLACTIQTGGFTRCDTTWGQNETSLPTYKIYYITAGSGNILMDSQHYELTPGKLYFISGYSIKKFWCDNFMDVYWLHFSPLHLLFDIHLHKCEPFYIFPNATTNRWTVALIKIPALLTSIRLSNKAELFGMLPSLAGDVLHHNKIELPKTSNEIAQLLPAVEFMDKHWKDNPPLEMIARQVSLTPNYFHNIFHDRFGLTPYNYMLQKRMALAKELILSGNFSVKQVALQCGYECPYHFSKIYKTYYKIAPKYQKHISQP